MVSLGTVRAGEALPVPGVVPVGHPSGRDHLHTRSPARIGHQTDLDTLDTLGGELVFITSGTVDIVLLGNEALCANGVDAGDAGKALLVPLSCLVLHLLHAGLEDISTTITAGCKLGVVARSAVDTVSF